MIARALTLAGGITSSAGLSQFPEFSQQYAQRLGGAVDELSRVVDEFDQDAADVGLSREEALADLAEGGAIGAERAETMTKTITRYERLSDDLAALEGAGPFQRAYLAARMTDSDVAGRAWQNFKPAIPATFEGAVFAGAGLLLGMFLVGGILSLLRLPFRRRAVTPE